MTATPPLQGTVAGAPLWRGRAGPVFAGELAFDHVIFEINGRRVLDDVSLRLEAGRIACLLGPSGCGKSTLLKLAAGVAWPSAGQISIDKVAVAAPGIQVPPERRSVGMMFQDFALFPHMTALQNVAFGLTALNRKEAQRVALLGLERVGLGALAGSYPAMMSGGEQQRVALARAIVPRPQMILMDEPFSSLDQRLKESVRADTLAILRETRATCLLVTHDPQEALAFADQVFLMRAGRIVQTGTPAEIQNTPVDSGAARFFRFYNEFESNAAHGKAETPLGTVPVPAHIGEQRVCVMVPPEDIELVSAGIGVPAMVEDSRYVGPHRQVRLRLADTMAQVTAYAPAEASWMPGQTCGLVLSPRHTHVFAV